MPSILLADDDTNLRGTLAAALTQEGFDVLPFANGAEALDHIDAVKQSGAAMPDVIVLDLLLPKKQGFDVAIGLRARQVQSPVVFISGVFKSKEHQDEAFNQHNAQAFLAKPFGPDKLVAEIERILSAQAAPAAATAAAAEKRPMPGQGGLLESPVIHLLWRAARESHTGILDVFGPRRGRVFVFRGRATMAQCNAPNINVGVELIRRGILTSEMYQKLIDLCVERGRGLYDVLRTEDWITKDQIKNAYRAVIPRVVSYLIAASGSFRWTDTDEFNKVVPGAPTSLLDAVKVGLRTATDTELEPHVMPRGPLRLAPGKNWAEVTAFIEAACGSDSMVRAINGRATVAQMLSAARDGGERVARMRQAYLLMSTEAVMASTEAITMDANQTAQVASQAARPAQPPAAQRPAAQEPAAPRPAPPQEGSRPQPASRPTSHQAQPTAGPGGHVFSDEGAPVGGPTMPRRSSTRAVVQEARSDEGQAFSPEEQAARQKILDKLAALDDKDHYEVLGVPATADGAQIKKAYFNLAREYHTDSFAGLHLGNAAGALDTLFALIQDAHSTLSNDGKRAEYDAARKMEEDGMSTDIAAILEAENDFAKAKTLVARGEMAGAVRLLATCVEVNPGNNEWKAYHDYANWWGRRDPREGKRLVNELGRIGAQMAGVPDITYFAGRVAMEMGDMSAARNFFRRTLKLNDRHGGATSALRRVNKAIEDSQKKSGGLGRFFKG